jgi:general secretion pathway protein G
MILSSDRRQLPVRRRHAFTLVEVLVVMAIVVVLASVATVAAFRYLENAKVDSAHVKAKTLAASCQNYYTRHSDEAPPNEGDWVAKVGPLVQGDPQNKFTDPWGQPYHVKFNEADGSFEVFTQHDNKMITSARKPD